MAGPSKGSKPDKILRDALILELNREDIEDGKKIKKISRVVHKLVSAAIEGEVAAIKEIFDRVEGKPMQAVELNGEIGTYVAALPGLSNTMDEWQRQHGEALKNPTVQ